MAAEMAIPRGLPSTAARLRYLLPLYVAALVVTLCGIGTVLATVEDPALGSLTITLTVVGFAVSLALRLSRVDPNLALYPAFGLGFFLAAWHFVTAGNLIEAVAGPAQSWQPDVALATFLVWLVVLRSFTLVTNYALLFCPVPTIALLGLTGSSNLNGEILIYFMVFLFATLFLVGYEHYLRLQQTVQREPDPIFRAHATTTLVLFVAVTVAGGLLTLIGRPVLSHLSPFAAPILRKAQQLPGFNQALQNQSNFVPVGSGPIDLSESPVMEVYAPEGGLWRTRVMDYWNGRGWSAREVDMPAVAISPGTVRAQRPAKLPPDDEYPEEWYQIPLPPDRHHDARVPARRVHQHIIIRTPLSSMGIPAAPRPVELRSNWEQVNVNDAGVIMGTGTMLLNPGVPYEVISEVSSPSPEELRQAPPVNPADFYQPSCLDVPHSLGRVRDLARQITAGVSAPSDKAFAIEAWLEKHCPYTLQEEAAPPGEDSVEYYLFTTREGACDLVGSAMAMMCRAAGIPARVAVGYSKDEPDAATGAFKLTQSDAHLWVELFFPGYGWVTFNPAPTPRETPPTAATAFLNRARRLIRNLERGGLATVLSLLLVGALLGAGAHTLNDAVRSHVRSRRAQQQLLRSDDARIVIPMLYRRMCDLLAQHGWDRRPAATPHEYLAALRAAAEAPPGPALAAAGVLTDRFAATRYGADPLPPADVEDARRQLAALVEALRAHRQGSVKH